MHPLLSYTLVQNHQSTLRHEADEARLASISRRWANTNRTHVVAPRRPAVEAQLGGTSATTWAPVEAFVRVIGPMATRLTRRSVQGEASRS